MRYVVVLFLAAALMACSDSKNKDAPAGTLTPAAPAAAAGWSSSAVWYDATALAKACGSEVPMACATQLMVDSGASAEARQFYAGCKCFLAEFRELGLVDWGTVGTPPNNMGRTAPVFLIGSKVENVSQPQSLAAVKGYESLKSAAGKDLLVWSEYSQLVKATSDAKGQTLLVETPLRECRACADSAYMQMTWAFDTQGRLDESRVLPPRLP